ncbi:6-phosphofructokinase [Nitrincola nitratireducens]|uniref:ATP-dependent 6-phosphofructokinase n=1 Tax=Nitrincola nitratireducens TaxID=1229521 RepID=W9UX10_9GAMM|nr:6-phosphofructokinase [Nitrincola nitratireducens]EXJ09266.1 6-phosphofructokinase isozyme 1 [Nitrincola nitratireducens]
MYDLPTLEPIRRYKSIAVLTSGGDAPGMNPAIRGVVRTALHHGIKVYGVQRGYSGLINGDIHVLSSKGVSNIVQKGGTFLKSARCSEFHQATIRANAASQLRKLGIEALIVIGGDGSLTGAHLFEEETGLPVIGIPGTIDNDIFGTDDTIGFDTAVNTALNAIDKIRDTADSHERYFLVEVMGRSSGFLAVHVGIAAGAEMIAVPEFAVDVEAISLQLATSKRKGLGSSGIIVVAEGNAPGLTNRIAEQMAHHGHTPYVSILGHIQRGGHPSGHDRVLASCLGAKAVEYLLAGYSDMMVGVNQGQVVDVPLDNLTRYRKGLDPELLKIALQLHK